MNSLVMLLVFIALGLVVLGSGRFRSIRLASRLLSFIGLAFFGLVTLASLYGMFALGDKGGGALLFIAVPAGIITGLFCLANGAGVTYSRANGAGSWPGARAAEFGLRR